MGIRKTVSHHSGAFPLPAIGPVVAPCRKAHILYPKATP